MPLIAKGDDGVVLKPYGGDAGNTSEIRLLELAAQGVNYVAIKAPDSIAANFTIVLPATPGSANQVIKTDGSGNLSFATADSLVTPVSPGGSDTYVQFNDGGSSFGGDSGLTYNKSSDTLTISGDLAVNGGDITSTSPTFNLINTTATTLNIGGAAGTITIGHPTAATTTIRGGTLSGNTLNQELFNTTTNGITLGSAANIINIGKSTSAAVTTIKSNLTVEKQLVATGGTTLLTDAELGNAAIGSWPVYDGGVESDKFAIFGHKDLDHSTGSPSWAGRTNYALYQDNLGNTRLNASDQKSLSLGVNNGVIGSMTNLNSKYQITFSGGLTSTEVVLGNAQTNSKTEIVAGGQHMTFTGATTTNYTMGTTDGVGTITIGKSTVNNIVNIATGITPNGFLQTVNIATGATGGGTSRVSIGNGSGSTSVTITGGDHVTLTGAVATDYVIGSALTEGTITIGKTTQANNTISIGSAMQSGYGTQTINIGYGAGKSVITIGSVDDVSSLTLYAGTGHMSFRGADQTNFTMGTSTSTGTITIGQSIKTNTINIGNAGVSLENIQTVNIANSTAYNGKAYVNICTSNFGFREINIGKCRAQTGQSCTINVGGNTILIGDSDSTTYSSIEITGNITCTGVSSTRSDLKAGKAEIGTLPGSSGVYAMFGHDDLNHAAGNNNYALVQQNDGSTFISSPFDKYISFLSAGNGAFPLARMRWNSTLSQVETVLANADLKTITVVGSQYSDSATAVYAGGAGTITIGGAGQSGKISIGDETNTANQTITVGYTNTYSPSSTTTTIYIGAGGSGYSKNSVKIGNYGSTSASDTTIYGDTIVMGTSGTTTVTIGSTTSSSSTSLQSGTGRITLNSADVGKWIGGAGVEDYAVFQHKNYSGTQNSYALIQSENGNVYLNAPSANNLYLRNNNSNRVQINTTGIGFFGATPIGQWTGTGTTTGYTAGLGSNYVKDVSTFTGNYGTRAYTVGDIVRALKYYGLLDVNV